MIQCLCVLECCVRMQREVRELHRGLLVEAEAQELLRNRSRGWWLLQSGKRGGADDPQAWAHN